MLSSVLYLKGSFEISGLIEINLLLNCFQLLTVFTVTKYVTWQTTPLVF